MPLPIRLSLFYAAFFAAGGVMMPFWPLWLEARGLSATEISVVMTAALWVRVATTPPIANWVDRTGRRSLALIGLSWAAAVAFALHGFAFAFLPVLVIGALHAMLRGPVLPLGDNIIMLLSAQHRLDYGRLRVWGSVSFLIATLAGGLVLRERSADLILVAIVLLLIVAALAAHALPPPAAEPAKARRAPVLRVLGNSTIWLFLLSNSATAASHAMFYALGSVHWRSQGLDRFEIGLLWGVGVAAEIAVFIWGRRMVERLGPAWLLLIGGVVGVPRWTVTAGTADFGLLCLMQVLHAGTFGLAHLGTMFFIARAVPPEVSASAQGVQSTAAGGIGLGLATLASGPLYARVGGDAYLAMAGLSVLAALAALALMRRWDGRILRI